MEIKSNNKLAIDLQITEIFQSAFIVGSGRNSADEIFRNCKFLIISQVRDVIFFLNYKIITNIYLNNCELYFYSETFLNRSSNLCFVSLQT